MPSNPAVSGLHGDDLFRESGFAYVGKESDRQKLKNLSETKP
jgi:hypothetical protein